LSVLQNRRANRQYKPIPDDEIWAFVNAREKLYVGFPMKSGYPHVTPMWFCILDKRVYLRTQDYKVKARLARGGKACCVVDDGSNYVELRGVVIWGQSRVVEEPDLISTIEKVMRMKYRTQQWKASQMPAWWVRERKAENRAYIEITPTRLSSWDNGKIR
jgi:nitroimidazol reductase NimA-like FMN-containing flavoprotein (pyridoxamine 5'-phosphate oxidase superfamily)